MTAVTAANIIVDSTQWTQLSAADVQLLQVLKGSAGVIFGAVQPADSVQVGSIGHTLSGSDYINNSTGGTSWGRADNDSVSAHIGITEG